MIHEPQSLTARNKTFRRDVMRGLRSRPKSIPCKYLYDRRGSELFEEICQLDEYYVTRTEIAILEASVAEIAERCGPACLVIEPGSGAGIKTEMLLRALEQPRGYVPLEISRAALDQTVERIHERLPGLPTVPVLVDFTDAERMRALELPPGRRLLFFPASTIGNFTPESAGRLLEEFRDVVGPDGVVLIGADLVKPEELLVAAYDDREGVTANFNKNLLRRINRELDGTFPVEQFEHRAIFNREMSRIEMHLFADDDCDVYVAGERVSFTAGESICTEHSHKYTLESFASLAAKSGLEVAQVWTDAQAHFGVHLLTPLA